VTAGGVSLVASPAYLAARGLGIARMPDVLVREAVRRGTLVTVLEAHAPAETVVNLVHLGGRYVTPRTRAFIDFIRPRLAQALTETGAA
jgi:DNA-binding transcriptional LysR family regulator